MGYQRLILLLFFSLVLLSLDTRTTNACSCGGKATVLEEYERANVIVIAQVVSVDKAPESRRSVDGILSARMIVEKVYKGTVRVGEEMIFAQGGGADCVWTFNEKSIGEHFLFYVATQNKEQKLWWAGTCGRSRPAEYATDDLLYLDNIEKVRGKTRLSGTLSFYQAPATEDDSPVSTTLERRKVRIIGEKKTYELITNQAGVYEIYDLPAGKYVIEPEIPEGWKIDYSIQGRRDFAEKDVGNPEERSFQTTVETGKHAYFDFRYGIDNAIRGKVFDTAGSPMKSVCLDLLPAEGKASRYLYKSDCTKEDGAFEITGIPPGRYVLATNKGGKISSSAPFQTFYYPNVFEREKALVIVIGPGHILEDMNIYVPRMEGTITVEGVALYSNGKPVVEKSIQFDSEEPGVGIDGKARAKTDSNGRFAIKILKGLKGTLYGEMFTYSGEFENCPKLEELIQQSGKNVPAIRTNVIEMRAEESIFNVELRFPFPLCQKAK